MKNYALLTTIAITTLSCAFTACGPNRNGISGNNAPGVLPSPTGANVTGPLTQPLCPNPISLEEPGARSFRSNDEIPTGFFRLTTLELHSYMESSHDSFTAIARQENGMAAEIVCDGLPALDSSTSSSSLRGKIQIGDLIAIEQPDLHRSERRLEVEISVGAAGRNVQQSSVTVPSTGDPRATWARIPTERTLVGIDQWVTLRLYQLSPSRLELRTKVEYAADAMGKRLIQYARATYDQSTN